MPIDFASLILKKEGRASPAPALQPGKKRLAPREHVFVGCVEVPRVPRVRDVVRRVGPIEQATHLSVGVAVKDAFEAPGILLVHVHDMVPFAVLGACDLTCAVTANGNADLPKLVDRAVVRRVADLLAARGSRVDHELVLSPGAARKVLKDELRHRRAAYIAVAYEENARHSYKTPDLRFYGCYISHFTAF